MKKAKILSLTLAIILLLSGCSKSKVNSVDSSETTQITETTAPTETKKPIELADMFTDRDLKTDFDESTAVKIKLNGNTASSSSNSVAITGSTVTITEEATYLIEGELADGQIIVNTKDTAKLQLVFNGVNVNSTTSAPLYILEADKVFLTLAANTENTLSNGGSFVAIDENNIDSVIFSKQDLTINGDGSLKITSPAGHGIVSKDDLVITGGAYSVVSASHAIDANDSIRVRNATMTLDAGKDGIHAENSDDASLGFVYIENGTYKIEAEGDGISTSSTLQITDGSYDILAGGGSVNAEKKSSDSYGGFMGGKPGGRPSRPGMPSYEDTSTSNDESSTSIKGIKSTQDMTIYGGSFMIDSADDSIHSNASITVNGGTFDISSGDDAFHADEALSITAGCINISKSYEGLEALNVTVSGGDIKLVASDDGINAAGGTDSSGMGGFRGGDSFGRGGMGGGMSSSSKGSIVISGGTVYINSSGDGIDANGTLTISGGKTTVCGPTQGDTATLDYDVSGVITGGTFIGTGAAGMAQTFSDSEQGVISVRLGNTAAETEITLKDTNGNVIITHKPELTFAVVIISTPEISKGKTYSLTVGTQTTDCIAK